MTEIPIEELQRRAADKCAKLNDIMKELWPDLSAAEAFEMGLILAISGASSQITNEREPPKPENIHFVVAASNAFQLSIMTMITDAIHNEC